jgi:hypothetical protein
LVIELRTEYASEISAGLCSQRLTRNVGDRCHEDPEGGVGLCALRWLTGDQTRLTLES